MSALSEGSDTKQRSRNSSSSWFFSLRYGGAFPWPNWNMIANWLSSHSNQGCYKRIYMSSFMYNIANSAVLKCIIMYKIILAVYSIILYTVHEHGPCTVCTMKYMYYTLYIIYLWCHHLHHHTSHTPYVHWSTHVLFKHNFRGHISYNYSIHIIFRCYVVRAKFMIMRSTKSVF